ncbi:saccharopine dehydrogenase family protein [Streptomyces sp. NPDC087270]|uniref:saccharopine dehydrogenase family protein n=1 Tax=Streptomyces sp. NPDC087270 TaxID=3365774 RepID=UPI00381B1702
MNTPQGYDGHGRDENGSDGREGSDGRYGRQAHRGAIAVFGAYGHTGVFVVRELRRRGWTPVLAGRDRDKLNAVARGQGGAQDGSGAEVRVASIAEPASLAGALEGAVAVVNCAGPFAATALPLVDAALRAGIPYLDVAAEQAVTLETFERRADRAREAGVPVVPSMAFYGGLGDLLASAAMGDWAEADDLTLAISLDSWRPTRGTRETVRSNAGRHLVFTGNRLVQPTGPAAEGSWEFPAPLGVQDVTELSTADQVTISRHLRVPEIRVHMNQAPLRDLSDPTTPPPAPADPDGRSAQTFLVDVVARRDGVHRRATASGRDIYAITAPLVVEAAERLLDGRVQGPTAGVLAPGALFDAPDFLRALSPAHLTFTGPDRLAVRGS